jgi:S-adenosylmethionine:tRNA ribosyltransferase-isomerase
MVLHRHDGTIEHRLFFEIVPLLNPGDVLVLNDSRVIPARLHGRRLDTGGVVELLLLRRLDAGIWEALARPSRRAKPGAQIALLPPEESRPRDGSALAEVMEVGDGGVRTVRLEDHALEQLGRVPLPPYIHTPLEHPERYQTVYARASGSVAAPTAGLHFTPELLESVKSKGVKLAFITLHVGLDSFRPVRVDDPANHPMHKEYFELDASASEQINRARREKNRIICVGTTAVRAIEEAALRHNGNGVVSACSGWTDLRILPGHRFRVVDALITNFHLPRSTLLMLVSAFAGKELIDHAYQEAIRLRYRFYSFGDALLIV